MTGPFSRCVGGAGLQPLIVAEYVRLGIADFLAISLGCVMALFLSAPRCEIPIGVRI